ncbi:MAG: hypothetical protein ACTHN3_03580 [Solirubrobacterales bacterium]
MGLRERQQTLENIVRLRTAEQRVADPEIAAVREDLESQLGGTVPRSSAARQLGVSHTALNKWVASGDVPVVITKQGRKEIPIPTLLELRERVAEQRRSGKRQLHALEPVMLEGRRRADRLRPDVERSGADDRRDPHQTAELRGLAYHRALAPRLRRPLVDQARRKLRRWKDEGRIDPRYARAWEEALALPLEEIRAAITADDQHGRDLRQSSPFAGLLSEQERRKILASV